MEFNKLIFDVKYPSLTECLKIYGEIDNSEKIFYIKAENNSNIICIYKMIIWKGGKLKRIYIHNILKSYFQLGYISVRENNQIDSLSFSKNFNVDPIIEYIFRLAFIYMFSVDKWIMPDKAPIKIKLEEIDFPQVQVNIINNYKINMMAIIERIKELIGIKSNITVEKTYISKEYEIINKVEEKPIKTMAVNCATCKYRKECVRKGRGTVECMDYVKGAAVGDYTQWS